MAARAAALDSRLGAKPPSSPTAVLMPLDLRTLARLWNTSAPMRRPSFRVFAPTGWIMNSWMSTLLSACSPPLMMFIIGRGIENTPGVPFSSAMCSYKGMPLAAAAALAVARETARIAFAPNLALFSVPSKSIMIWSIAAWSLASLPARAAAIGPFTASTAFSTPLPRKRDLSPSRSSRASREPVEAPEGAAARPMKPPSR